MLATVAKFATNDRKSLSLSNFLTDESCNKLEKSFYTNLTTAYN